MWVQFVDWGGDTRRTHEEWGRKLEGEGPNKEAISEPVISMGSYRLSKIPLKHKKLDCFSINSHPNESHALRVAPWHVQTLLS